MKNFKKIISGVLSASMILTAAISGTSVSASASNTHRIGDVTGNGVVDLTDLNNPYIS